MFAGKIKLFLGRLGVRLVVYYSFYLICSFLVLFFSMYWLMSSTLKDKDRELIIEKEKEYALLYEKGGINEIQQSIQNKNGQEDNWVYVRLESNAGETLFQRIPSDSKNYNYSKIINTHSIQKEKVRWIYLNQPSDEDLLEVFSEKMADGTILQIGRNSDDREAILEQLATIFLVLGIPIILLGLIGGFFVSSRALKPIRSLIQALQRLGEGEITARMVEEESNDELTKLAHVFNQMADRIHDLIKGMRGVINDIAHDLRTPMTRFRGVAENALNSKQDISLYHEALVECIESSDRILTIVDTVMEIAEAQSGSIHLKIIKVNIKNIIEEAVDLYSIVAEDNEVVVHVDIDSTYECLGDSRYLIRAFANLLDNAIKYNHAGGHIWITAQQQNDKIFISIRDNGIGMASEELTKIWQRLYRVDKSRSKKGLGLGLPLVKAIAEAHGGSVSVISSIGQGSTFQIQLPC